MHLTGTSPRWVSFTVCSVKSGLLGPRAWERERERQALCGWLLQDREVGWSPGLMLLWAGGLRQGPLPTSPSQCLDGCTSRHSQRFQSSLMEPQTKPCLEACTPDT